MFFVHIEKGSYQQIYYLCMFLLFSDVPTHKRRRLFPERSASVSPTRLFPEPPEEYTDSMNTEADYKQKADFLDKLGMQRVSKEERKRKISYLAIVLLI